MYATKDTYNIDRADGRRERGVARSTDRYWYETLRPHYGNWLRLEGADQLGKIADLAPDLAPKNFRGHKQRKLLMRKSARRGT